MTNNNDELILRLEQIRWDGQPKCPYCESTNATAFKNERRYHCNNCFTSYSVTVGTLFHKTYVHLEKWFLAINIFMKSPESVSARQLAKQIGVNKNTACYMIERIRQATVKEPDLLHKLVSRN